MFHFLLSITLYYFKLSYKSFVFDFKKEIGNQTKSYYNVLAWMCSCHIAFPLGRYVCVFQTNLWISIFVVADRLTDIDWKWFEFKFISTTHFRCIILKVINSLSRKRLTPFFWLIFFSLETFFVFRFRLEFQAFFCLWCFFHLVTTICL